MGDPMDVAPLALVTGASRGIGRAVALQLAHRGVRLALLGRASPQASSLLAELGRIGPPPAFFEVELADTEQLEQRLAELVAREGIPSVVINNAAMIERGPVESIPPEIWDRHLAVNLRAPFLITRALLPQMKARGSGRLLYVASIAATLGTAHAAAYGASKWGLLGFVKCLAEELRDTGLMAACVLPGSVDTDMLVGSGFEPRITPEEVATTLTYLALDAPLSHNGSSVELFGV
jgi:3-oxoacyl-[acyl-carrier protein] reductase